MTDGGAWGGRGQHLQPGPSWLLQQLFRGQHWTRQMETGRPTQGQTHTHTEYTLQTDSDTQTMWTERQWPGTRHILSSLPCYIQEADLLGFRNLDTHTQSQAHPPSGTDKASEIHTALRDTMSPCIYTASPRSLRARPSGHSFPWVQRKSS